jgi:hypothetical protein
MAAATHSRYLGANPAPQDRQTTSFADLVARLVNRRKRDGQQARVFDVCTRSRRQDRIQQFLKLLPALELCRPQDQRRHFRVGGLVRPSGTRLQIPEAPGRAWISYGRSAEGCQSPRLRRSARSMAPKSGSDREPSFRPTIICLMVRRIPIAMDGKSNAARFQSAIRWSP